MECMMQKKLDNTSRQFIEEFQSEDESTGGKKMQCKKGSNLGVYIVYLEDGRKNYIEDKDKMKH